MTARLVAVVSGHVQGVGYRYFVRGLAETAGVAGWARNLPNGSVEVVLEGADEDISGVAGALDGPDAPGTVTGVQTRTEPARGIDDFTTS